MWLKVEKLKGKKIPWQGTAHPHWVPGGGVTRVDSKDDPAMVTPTEEPREPTAPQISGGVTRCLVSCSAAELAISRLTDCD